MKPNVAGQEISAIILDAAGAEVTTGATTVGVNIDGTPGTGGAATYTNGEWVFPPIQSDTNGAKVNFKFTNAGGPPVLIQVYTNFPQSVDNDVKLSATALEATSQNILAQVTGTGNRVVTVHVQDTIGDPIADVLVRIGTASDYTDPAGDEVFTLDDGDYDVIPRKDFVTFAASNPITVSGDGTKIIVGTVFAPSLPTQPGTCVVYGNVIDIGADPVLGTTIEIKETDSSTFSNTQKIVLDKETTSDVDGYWQLEVIRSSGLVPLNSPYLVVIKNGNGSFERVETITVPDADSAEYSTIIDS